MYKMQNSCIGGIEIDTVANVSISSLHINSTNSRQSWQSNAKTQQPNTCTSTLCCPNPPGLVPLLLLQILINELISESLDLVPDMGAWWVNGHHGSEVQRFMSFVPNGGDRQEYKTTNVCWHRKMTIKDGNKTQRQVISKSWCLDQSQTAKRQVYLTWHSDDPSWLQASSVISGQSSHS